MSARVNRARNTLYNKNIACSENCASCDDSACKECNAPFALNQDNKCQLCEEGTYFADKSCKGISFLKMKMNNYWQRMR